MSKVRLPMILLPDVQVRGHRLPDVAIPTVDLRRAPWFDVSDLRRFSLPAVSRPDVTVPASIRERSMADVRLPDVRLSEFRIPELHRPDVHLPEIRVPDMHIPDVQLADLHRPQFDLPQFERPQLSMPNLDIPRIDVRIRRNERRGPGTTALAAVFVGAVVAGGWWLWTSPAIGPRVRTAAIRVRRRAERTWALMRTQPEFDDAEVIAATEPFWSQAEGFRPEGGGFEPGDATLETTSDAATTADADRAAAWEAPGTMTSTEPIAPREPVGAGNGSGRHAGESPTRDLDATERFE